MLSLFCKKAEVQERSGQNVARKLFDLHLIRSPALKVPHTPRAVLAGDGIERHVPRDDLPEGDREVWTRSQLGGARAGGSTQPWTSERNFCRAGHRRVLG